MIMKRSINTVFGMWLATLASGVFADSSEDARAGQALLDSLRLELLNQSIDSGLSIKSTGFIDASGRLVESTYFETDTQIRGFANARLLQQSRQTGPGVSALLTNAGSPDGQTCVSSRNPYQKEVGISIRRSGWDSRIENSLAEEVSRTVGSFLSDEIEVSPHWFATRAPQDNASVSSTRYFALLNNANRDVRSARYLIDVQIAFDRERTLATQGLRNLRSAGGRLLTDLSRSKLVADAVTANRNESFAIQVSLTLRDTLTGSEFLQQRVRLSVPTSARSLMPRRLSGRALNKLTRELSEFATRLNTTGTCLLEHTAISAQANLITPEAHRVQLDKGRAAGIELGDRFILSTTPFRRTGSGMDPEVIDSLAIGQVTAVNQHNASVDIIAGQTHRPFITAVPF